jgi:hypothetical protein
VAQVQAPRGVKRPPPVSETLTPEDRRALEEVLRSTGSGREPAQP